MPTLEPGQRYVIDGAMATELERRGADLDDPLWSAKILLEQPALIEAVHLDYFAAGADIATTASYQASLAGFCRRGLPLTEARQRLRDSVTLAQRARARHLATPAGAGRRPLIAASMGPYGAHRHDGSEYHGEYGVGAQALREFHVRQLDVLAETAADLMAFETIPSLPEAEVVLRLLEEFPGVRAWLSFSCQDGARVCHGERFADCVALTRGHAGVVAVGVNCTAPRWVEALLRGAAGRTDKPLLAYPNSGERFGVGSAERSGAPFIGSAERSGAPFIGSAERRTWLPADEADDLPGLAPRWLAAGATLLGGCCRTTPMHTRALAQLVGDPPDGRES